MRYSGKIGRKKGQIRWLPRARPLPPSIRVVHDPNNSPGWRPSAVGRRCRALRQWFFGTIDNLRKAAMKMQQNFELSSQIQYSFFLKSFSKQQHLYFDATSLQCNALRLGGAHGGKVHYMKLIGTICGEKKMPRTEVTKKIWVYIKKNKLNDVRPLRLV